MHLKRVKVFGQAGEGYDGTPEWRVANNGEEVWKWEMFIPHYIGSHRIGGLSTCIFVYASGHVDWYGKEPVSFDSVEEAKAYVEATYALEE